MTGYNIQEVSLSPVHPAAITKARAYVAAHAIDAADARGLMQALGLITDPLSKPTRGTK